MIGFEDDWLLSRFLWLIPLVLSLSVHESAHAWTAMVLGDDTALRMGRVTFNPLEHIDPIGTLILPLLGIPFGWAKPVPVNPARFRSDVGMGTGLLLVAAAGPASNLCIAIGLAALLGGFARLAPNTLYGTDGLVNILQNTIMLNVLLAFFNLMPVPPLDGSRVADALMPGVLRPFWDRYTAYGGVALVALFLLPGLLGFNMFPAPMAWAQRLCDVALGT